MVDYVLDVLTAERDIEDPKVKGEIARQVLPLIEDVADPVEREAYRQKLARRLMVDERALLEYRKVAPKAERVTVTAHTMPGADVEDSPAETAMERFCLGTLLNHPESLYRIDRELQALEQERLSVKDFNGSDLRVIFQAVRSALNQDEEEPVDYWRNSLDETLLNTAESLLGEAGSMDLNQPKVLGEVLANFLRLRKRNLESQLSQLRFRIEAVQGMEIDQDKELRSQLWDHTREVQQLASKKERLDRALAQPSGIRSSVPPGEW